jgi:putative iron-only hydrogenase system regulator
VYAVAKELITIETRVAVLSIIVESGDAVPALNDLLHSFGEYIVGRLGIPYRSRGISIINIAIDAPQDAINRLAGAIGRLNGVSAKTVYAPASASEN